MVLIIEEMELQQHNRETVEQAEPINKRPAARAGEEHIAKPAQAEERRFSQPAPTLAEGERIAKAARVGEGRMEKAGKRRELRSNYLQRSHHHDYCRPARYMITLVKSPNIGALSRIIGNPRISPHHENAPKVELLADGRHVENAMVLWLKQYPELRVRRYVIMPDHVHICLQVMGYIRIGLGSIIGNFMGKCSRLRHDALHPKAALPMLPTGIVSNSKSGGYEGKSVEIEKFFERGFNDRIAYNDAQWERQHRYVDDNPRRLLIKRQHPDLYFKRWLITTDDGQNFIAQGNIMLLRNPDLQVVRFSRRFSEAFYATCVDNWEKCVENNGVLISPFIHPKEREIRDWALSNGGEIIRICENGFGDRFVPQGKEFEYNGTSKLLLIASLGHNTKRDDMTRAKAMGMNAVAQSIASIDWLAGKGSIKVMK